MSRALVLYSRPGCHLCDVMLGELQPLLQEHGLKVRVVDISTDPALMRRFALKIPVLALDGEPLCQYRLDAGALRRALGDASSQR